MNCHRVRTHDDRGFVSAVSMTPTHLTPYVSVPYDTMTLTTHDLSVVIDPISMTDRPFLGRHTVLTDDDICLSSGVKRY